jgi:hypothetical protein
MFLALLLAKRKKKTSSGKNFPYISHLFEPNLMELNLSELTLSSFNLA